jgi:hypothetical protein
LNISLEVKIRLKISSVRSIRDPEGRDGYKIEFVEVRERPPRVTMTPTNVPKEISQVMTQVTQVVQSSLPGATVKEYELQKVTITFTAEELEAFKLKPYPNQIYEVTVADGKFSFKQV